MPAKSKTRPFLLVIVILVLAALLTSPTTSFAQAETVYDLINTDISLNVQQGDTPVVAPTAEPTAVVAPVLSMATSTPNPDGSVTHVVKDGESLWSIATAYGVSVEQIQNLNGMTSDFTVINIGQNLLIYAVGSLPTSTVVDTVEVPGIETQVQSTAPVQRATATANLVKPVEDVNGTEAALAKAASLQTLATPVAPVRKLTAGKIVGVIVVPIVGVLLLLFVLNFQGFDHWKLPWKH